MAYDLSMGVTQSMLQAFTKCRVSCKLSLDGWGSPVPKRATQFGSFFHSLLQETYRPDKRRPKDAVMDRLAVFRRCAKKYEQQALQEGDSVDAIQQDLAMAKALYPAYINKWEKSDARKTWVEVEQVFDYFPKGWIRFRGKIDGVFRIKDSLWILETKTASSIDSDTLNMALAFDFQNLFYIRAVEHKLGEPVKGVLYNVIRKPSIGRGKCKTDDAYVNLLWDDIKLRPDFYFARFEVFYSDAVRKRFEQDLFHRVQEFKSWWNEYLPTYPNESACRGKWNCSYLPVCASGRDPQKAGFEQNRKLFGELEEE